MYSDIIGIDEELRNIIDISVKSYGINTDIKT